MGAKKQKSEKFLFNPFENLKEIIESKGIKVSPSKTESKKAKPVSDEELFADAMKEVREIREFRKMPVHKKKAPSLYRNTSSDHEALTALEEIVTGQRPLKLSDTQEYVEWVNQDYRFNITRKLHEGRYAVQDCLDLHGLVIEQAETEVERFLKDSVRKGYRCVKIIHGRGLRSPRGPVLKNAVIKWLSGRYRKNIIAFVTARQCDGGLGALYVLLR